jgi:hypothetical protein
MATRLHAAKCEVWAPICEQNGKARVEKLKTIRLAYNLEYSRDTAVPWLDTDSILD